ncbi:CDP-alcohol phosphatidyltransferase family protein [Tessaracoccus coleopterorum]|uniref:CDP-alcohol phosphatidyltransferase family protein n=1 Tax=Tessaracoccus coleopterorum TaxID=2714950 RepID=UPI0018D41345|nr:CDP-alcohol phosphatidyltransferase family protein [Tessaracoccus coleopterorum]
MAECCPASAAPTGALSPPGQAPAAHGAQPHGRDRGRNLWCGPRRADPAPCGPPGRRAAVICVFLLGDGLDGTMARLGGRETRFGAFLDSTLDRLADAAVFAGIVVWAAGHSQGSCGWGSAR